MQTTSPNRFSSAIGRLSTLLAASALVAAAGSDATARPPSGGYFGFGVGYAIVAGEKGVDLRTGIPGNILGGSEAYRDIVRTQFGEGMGFELRFGWLIGPIAPEIGLVGHGTFDFKNGAGYPLFTLRFHPLLLVDSLVDLPFDFNVFVGAGYAIGGYRHEIGNDDKGWEGWAPTTGLGLTYDLSASVRLGLDLRFVLPQYRTFLYDWDDDIEFKAEDIPKTMVFIPSLQIIASF